MRRAKLNRYAVLPLMVVLFAFYLIQQILCSLRQLAEIELSFEAALATAKAEHNAALSTLEDEIMQMKPDLCQEISRLRNQIVEEFEHGLQKELESVLAELERTVHAKVHSRLQLLVSL